MANARIASPLAMRGSHLAFAAADSLRRSALAASTAVDRNGEGASVRAISRAIRPAPVTPKSMPPNSCGTSTPVQPISAHSRQNAREKPSGEASARNWRHIAIGAFAAIAPRALSISIRWSSFSTSMRAHSVGSSSSRLATISSMISEVPPSIELPFERSQPCATSCPGPPLPSK